MGLQSPRVTCESKPALDCLPPLSALAISTTPSVATTDHHFHGTTYMGMVWTPNGPFRRIGYASEADLEAAILLVRGDLFGQHRIYLDVKKKIGQKGGVRNIPDGYVLDLGGTKPRLYVVENELAVHEPLRHIAVQILEFSLSFEAEPRKVKGILFSALQAEPDSKQTCETYALTHGFRNLDHLLEHLVFDSPFAALVIIDEMPEGLENVLSRKFQFGVEVLELARYQSESGEQVYHFEPFLADLVQDLAPAGSAATKPPDLEVDEVDTVVVPAREEGFKEVFLGENRWYAIRIHGTMRPQIKYIAAYQIAPISAITHFAPVDSIQPWKDTDKYVVNFLEPAHAITPIPLVKGGRVKALQNLRYTTRHKLEAAKTLEDLW